MLFFRLLLWLQIFFNRWIWFSLLLFALMYVLYGVNYTPYAKNDFLLSKSPTTAQGIVTGIDVTKDFAAFFSDLTQFRYEYRTPDQEDIVSYSYTRGFEKLNIGDTVTVKILPDNYYISRIKGMECSRFDRRASVLLHDDWFYKLVLVILIAMVYEGWRIKRIFGSKGVAGRLIRKEQTNNAIGNWAQEKFYFSYADETGREQQTQLSTYRPSVKKIIEEQKELRILIPKKEGGKTIAYNSQAWLVRLLLRFAFPEFRSKQKQIAEQQETKKQTQAKFGLASLLLFVDLLFNKWVLSALLFVGIGYVFHGINYSPSVELDKRLDAKFATTKGVITGFNTRTTAESIFSDLTEFRYEYRTPDMEDITSYSYAWGRFDITEVGQSVTVEYSPTDFYLSRIQGMSCSRYDPMAWRKVAYWVVIAVSFLVLIFISKVKLICKLFVYEPVIAEHEKQVLTGNEYWERKQVKITFRVKNRDDITHEIWVKTYRPSRMQQIQQKEVKLLIPASGTEASICVDWQSWLIRKALSRMFPV